VDASTNFKNFATGIAAVAVPIVLALASHWVSLSLKKSDIEMRTLELAIQILDKDPSENPNTPQLREWAANVLKEYSGVTWPEGTTGELKSFRLPQFERTSRYGASALSKMPQARGKDWPLVGTKTFCRDDDCIAEANEICQALGFTTFDGYTLTPEREKRRQIVSVNCAALAD
jgi:hypothetical protein